MKQKGLHIVIILLYEGSSLLVRVLSTISQYIVHTVNSRVEKTLLLSLTR